MASHVKQRREVLSESRMQEIRLSGSMSSARKCPRTRREPHTSGVVHYFQ